MLQGGEAPLVIVGAGARRRRRDPGRGGRARQGRSARSRRSGTASACCTRPPPASARLDLGFVPGEGGLDFARHAGAGRRSTCCSTSAPTRSTSRPGAFVVYQGTHGDRGASPRRRDPAGRRLHREVGDLRQHGGPGADGQPRRLPAGRGPRGLGDPARPVGRAGPAPALRFARPRCAGRSTPSTRISRRVGAVEPGDVAAAVDRLAGLGGARGRGRPSRRRSPTSTSPTRSPAPRACMAECSRLARERAATRLAAAE